MADDDNHLTLRRTSLALAYPLTALGEELDACSPELRYLLRLALAGANGEPTSVSVRDQSHAAMRLNDAVLHRTTDAKADRKRQKPTPGVMKVVGRS